ncbi:hypothetical protein SDJN03_18276, partial [Cucurbita argyrosperma subsp. sororia]
MERSLDASKSDFNTSLKERDAFLCQIISVARFQTIFSPLSAKTTDLMFLQEVHYRLENLTKTKFQDLELRDAEITRNASIRKEL